MSRLKPSPLTWLAVCTLACAASARVRRDIPVSTGSMVDPRDSTRYATVTIGAQRWMAANLDYKVGASWCYENKADNCKTYGRLYDWESAKAACPSGWHLPSDTEWTILETAVDYDDLGLKSTNMQGTDYYGFTVLPAGYRGYNGKFENAGMYAHFWSATKGDRGFAWGRNFHYDDAIMGRYQDDITSGFSVRCVETSVR